MDNLFNQILQDRHHWFHFLQVQLLLRIRAFDWTQFFQEIIPDVNVAAEFFVDVQLNEDFNEFVQHVSINRQQLLWIGLIVKRGVYHVVNSFS